MVVSCVPHFQGSVTNPRFAGTVPEYFSLLAPAADEVPTPFSEEVGSGEGGQGAP